jgi:hypothetical protein
MPVTPAGYEMNDRTNRRQAPEEDRGPAVAVEPAVGAGQGVRVDVQPPAVALEQRPPAPAPDAPADERAADVAEGSRGDEHEKARDAGRERVAEERGMGAQRAARQGARDQHRQLATGGEERVERHDGEHGVDAVARDRVGERLRDGGEHGRGHVRPSVPATPEQVLSDARVQVRTRDRTPALDASARS